MFLFRGMLSELTRHLIGLPWWLSGKESDCNAGDPGSIPGSGRSLGERNGNPLKYSCLENPMERGAWWAIIHVVAKSQTWLKWVSTHMCITHYVEQTFTYLLAIHISSLENAYLVYFPIFELAHLLFCYCVVCCCSVIKLCPTICDPMNCSAASSPVLHYHPEFAQIHVRWVSDAI